MDNQEIFLGVVSASLFVLLLIVAIVLVLSVAARQKLQQQMVLAETRLAFERELRTVETEVTETMMSHFAQELHDNIGQLLTALHIQVENQKLDHPELAESFRPAEIYVSEIGQQLRLLSRTLNNDYLGHIGILAALKTEIRRLQSLRRFTVHSDIPEGPSNLEKNQELMVFRMFQEITQNALRHAKANNVFVTVENSAGRFSLKVRDDGQGFDLEGMMRSEKASGLRNMQKRAELASLALQVSSEPGKGTEYSIEKSMKETI